MVAQGGQQAPGAWNSCYWPNGDLAPDNWTPCPNSKVCCTAGEMCLTNNLCYEANLNIAYRGACSDRSWSETYCPHICHKGENELRLHTNNKYGYQLLTFSYACPNNTNQVFTCGGSGWASVVCKAGLGLYHWQSGKFYAVANYSYPSLSSPTSPPTTAAATATAAAISEPVSSTSSSSFSSKSAFSHFSQSIQIGLGIGLGLGNPLLIVTAAFLFFSLRGRNRQKQKHSTSGDKQYPLFGPHQRMERNNDEFRELEGTAVRQPELGGRV
ncbi:hypothetical protein M432DRAFT_645818 [Thermoascus aurantiacus ATCC 26904]